MILNLSKYIDKEQAQGLYTRIDQKSRKLEQYYNKKNGLIVYVNSCLLEPKGKDILLSKILSVIVEKIE